MMEREEVEEAGSELSIYREEEVSLVRRFRKEFLVESLEEWKMTSRPPAWLVDHC